MLVGSEGVDEVSYLRESAAVVVDLGGRRSQGAAAGDSYQSIERFTLTRFNDTFLGGADVDRVAGGVGNDMLSGLGGNDVLDGGVGDDVFDGGAGEDTLTGGAGNDVLNGATGADVMHGGTGNDRYVVDDAGDVVVESGALDGTDRVEASIAYTLGDHVETLFLTGTATIAGTGNALANTIVGNAAGNVIDGGAGADLMEGKAGNDRYIVDNVGDKVLEADGAGNDSVEASVSFSLAGQYIESLRLTGTAAINGTGNGQANSLFGNAAANKLNGGAGDDKLHGGAGKDELTGGSGLDRFVFDSALNGATNVDKILDFNVADDGIYLDRAVFKAVASGALAASAFAPGTTAADAGDRILYDQASGNIWYDADGSGAGAAILFATVTAGTALTAADFIAF
jgi:Ca2+-binding RTX toxin-like protein